MADGVSVVAEGFSFLEGPRWKDGLLYASDFYTNTVYAFETSGRASVVCSVPQQPSGLGFLPDGSLLVVSMHGRRILRARDGRVEDYADLSALTPYSCNDMLVDGAGRAYVGNFGWEPTGRLDTRSTNLIMVSPDGSAASVAGDLVFPNGMALTPDGAELIVAETFAARISAFEVGADGRLRDRKTWARFTDAPFPTIPEALSSGAILPDGLALDADGAVWVADAGGQGIKRFARGGEALQSIDVAPLAVFAAALGGEDRGTLYMCAAPPFPNDPSQGRKACLLSCRVDVPGAGLP